MVDRVLRPKQSRVLCRLLLLYCGTSCVDQLMQDQKSNGRLWTVDLASPPLYSHSRLVIAIYLRVHFVSQESMPLSLKVLYFHNCNIEIFHRKIDRPALTPFPALYGRQTYFDHSPST